MRWSTAPRPAGEERGLTLDGQEWRNRRERLGLTIEELAERLDMEPHVLAGIEKGHRRLTERQAFRLLQKVTLAERKASRAAISRALASSPTAAAVGEGA